MREGGRIDARGRTRPSMVKLQGGELARVSEESSFSRIWMNGLSGVIDGWMEGLHTSDSL